MKSFFKLTATLFSIVILQTSCRDCCNGENYEFRIRLELTLLKNDTLKVYYLAKNSKVFSESLSIKTPIQGDFHKQFIEICLPEEPKDLRISFSKNSINKELKVFSVLFENNDNQFFIKGEEFKFYFIGNKFMMYDKLSKTYKFKPTNNGSQEPFIRARNDMKDRLLKRLSL